MHLAALIDLLADVNVRGGPAVTPPLIAILVKAILTSLVMPRTALRLKHCKWRLLL